VFVRVKSSKRFYYVKYRMKQAEKEPLIWDPK
jgi:hypothetical protein